MKPFSLILVDPNPEVCAAFLDHFSSLDYVDIARGYFEQVTDFDCMVSAANSFGIMDGGVDLAIVRFFGIELEYRVQQHILQHYLGEQPVGTSFIVETGHPTHPFLAHTPTMRVPMEIARTDNVYRAMWAMLLAVRQHNSTAERKIQTVACPGLGTSTGRVPPHEAAYQMALAWQHFLSLPSAITWRLARERQEQIRYGGDYGLQMAPHTE